MKTLFVTNKVEVLGVFVKKATLETDFLVKISMNALLILVQNMQIATIWKVHFLVLAKMDFLVMVTKDA